MSLVFVEARAFGGPYFLNGDFTVTQHPNTLSSYDW